MEAKHGKCWLLLTLAVCLYTCSCHANTSCTSPLGITVTPTRNQVVPINTDVNITYTCTVDGNRRAEWDFRGVQIPSDSATILNRLADSGIIITPGATISQTSITITQAGREVYSNEDLKIVCTALTEEGRLDIEISCDYFVRTYDIPNVPRNFDFNPFPGNASRLVLTWDEPDNTLVDAGDPIVTTYNLTASGPRFNFTEMTTERSYEIVSSSMDDCAMHDFAVIATNGAGQGMPAALNATIPISPDIDDLEASLAVSRVFTSPNVTVEVSFPPALDCSLRFPLQAYIVTIVGVVAVSYPVNAGEIAGKDIISLNASGPGFQQNGEYSVFVSACISVTCRHSNPPIPVSKS